MSPPLWAPGPAPRPDGLREAFASAQRRRLRTAALTAAPMVLALSAVVVAPSLRPAPTSLEYVTPTDDASTTGSRQPAPAVGEVATPDEGSPRTAPGVGAAESSARGASAAGTTTARHETTMRTQNVVLSAKRTASARVVLREPLHPSMDTVRFSTAGAYAGVYFRSDDGSVRGGVVRIPAPPHTTDKTWLLSLGDVDALPPGAYTVYVIGDVETKVTLPLARAERGFTLTATRPARAAYSRDQHALGIGELAAEVRIPLLGDTSAVGAAGATVYTAGGRTSTGVSICLARHDAACASSDPQHRMDTTATVDGNLGTSVEIRSGTLDIRRDAVGRAETMAATDAELTVWSFVLDL